MRTFAFILLSASLACATSAIAADQSFLKLVQTIALDGVEGRIDHLAADPQRMRLYIAALGNDSLEVVDLEAGKHIHGISGLRKPTGARVLPDSGNIIGASGEDGIVRRLDPDLNLIGKTEGLDDADNVRLDPTGKF